MHWRRRRNNSWNRRGGPKGRGGSKVEMVLLDSKERMGRRFFRSVYHPVAARHPSCSRRGVVPPSPPMHSHLHKGGRTQKLKRSCACSWRCKLFLPEICAEGVGVAPVRLSIGVL